MPRGRQYENSMRNDAIGVFDSGMGGLTTVKELNALLPHENIIYFGDTARIPYGSRSHETVMRYAREDVDFLRKHAVKMIIAACGTVSSVVGSQPFVTDMPFTGVVLPAAEAACRLTKNGKIGVIGTAATVRSGSYEQAIQKHLPTAEVTAQACPLFVHLVENGYTDFENPVTRLVAEEYLESVQRAGVDTLILGCTHYPVIRHIIADIMGDGVQLVSPGVEAAKYAKKCLSEHGLLTESAEQGENTYYVSDSTEMFIENAGHFLHQNVVGKVFRCNL